VNDLFELILFAGIMAVAQFSPGPDMILLTRTSLRYGGRAGAIMACGIATGLMVHALIALSGAGYLFASGSFFLPYAKTAASLYLAYLAWQVWHSEAQQNDADASPERHHYLRGLYCNILNPKAALVLSSICAPFLQGNHGLHRPLVLGAIIVIQGAVLWMAWAYLLQAQPIRHGYQRCSTIINRCFSCLLLLLATMLWWR
jgi:threonine efflux protein